MRFVSALKRVRQPRCVQVESSARTESPERTRYTTRRSITSAGPSLRAMRSAMGFGTPSSSADHSAAGSQRLCRRVKLGATTAPPTTNASVAPINT